MQYKLILEYDGTNYHGWQLQSNAVTLQGTLEAVLCRLFNEPIRVRAAGRTDAGVHALGQVVSFRTSQARDLPSLQRGINALLPSDMAVKHFEVTTETFNPRRDAKSRVYRYQMWNQPSRSAIWARYSWHVPITLNIERMDKAAAVLVGHHDFSSFQGADSVEHNPLRTVLRSTLHQEGEFVVYDVEAVSFCAIWFATLLGPCLTSDAAC